MKKRIIVAVTGASGAAIGVRVIELLTRLKDCEVHLVVSKAGEKTVAHEVGPNAMARIESLVAFRHAMDDIGATVASGSFRSIGMIVAPCSVHTLSAIAAGLADNLILRAAHVHLKERRSLILMVRESPLHLGHLRAMTAVAEYGAIVSPPVPAFYLAPRNIDDMVDHMARRAISLLGDTVSVPQAEWAGLSTPARNFEPDNALAEDC